MAINIHGDTSGLKASQAKALAKLGERTVPPDRVVSQALAREMVELSRELNRRLGLYIDRRGRVRRVILGSASGLDLPEFERVRGTIGRLRGVRLVSTHLLTEALDREELADLSKLRFDLLAALHLGPAGIQVDVAVLRPGDSRGAYLAEALPRLPIGHVAPDSAKRLPAVQVDLPFPLGDFIRELEVQLNLHGTSAREEIGGTRAVALVVHRGGAELEARKAELSELCRTAGVHLLEIIVQRRPRPDPRTFMGAGKLREVLVRALEQDAEMLICDPELSPSQAREISSQSALNVIDRTMLILDIFAQHAKSSDGKLQVELAQQRYRLPRLAGKGTMMSRLAGGIGGRGPGESKLEVDRRRAQKRITELERRLKKMQAQRQQRRAKRTRSGVPVVAIVGYTNAGKSTFLNTITQSTVRAENKLFATLDPTVRRIRFPREREVVLLDTVGFIRELPPALMQAFSATLEEVAEADLLLHLVDVTDPDSEQQMRAVEKILDELGASELPRLLVFNKCDLLDADVRPALDVDGPPRFWISAIDRRSTRPLMEAIESAIWGPRPRAGTTASLPTVETDPVAEEVGDESPGEAHSEEE
jgi:GTP-binding protein HflX